MTLMHEENIGAETGANELVVPDEELGRQRLTHGQELDIRVGHYVWEGLAQQVGRGTKTPEEAETFYRQWFPHVPHAALPAIDQQ